MSDEQVPVQNPAPQVVYVQAPQGNGPMTFTVAGILPWVLMVAVLMYFLGSRNTGPAPSPGPTPVVPVPSPEKSVVEKLDEILNQEEGLYLSAVCKNVSLLLQKDGENEKHLFNSTKDVQTLINNTGTVVTLDHGPYNGLGAVLATYFDEEAEFPQKVGDLTPDARAKAVSNWQKMSEDLAKVK